MWGFRHQSWDTRSCSADSPDPETGGTCKTCFWVTGWWNRTAAFWGRSIYIKLQFLYLEMTQAWKLGRECWGWGRAGGRHCLYTKPRCKTPLILGYPAVCVTCVTSFPPVGPFLLTGSDWWLPCGIVEAKCTCISIPRPGWQCHAWVFCSPFPAFGRKLKCYTRQSPSALTFPSLLLPSIISFSTSARQAGACHFSTAQTSKWRSSQLDVKTLPLWHQVTGSEVDKYIPRKIITRATVQTGSWLH